MCHACLKCLPGAIALVTIVHYVFHQHRMIGPLRLHVQCSFHFEMISGASSIRCVKTDKLGVKLRCHYEIYMVHIDMPVLMTSFAKVGVCGYGIVVQLIVKQLF